MTTDQARLKKTSDTIMAIGICTTAFVIALVNVWAFRYTEKHLSHTLAMTWLVASLTIDITVMVYLYGPTRARVFEELERRYPE